MFKKLRNAIARRRDMRLRKWCVKRGYHANTGDVAYDAELIYLFLKGRMRVKN